MENERKFDGLSENQKQNNAFCNFPADFISRKESYIMEKLVIIIISILCLTTGLSAQKNELVTVKAGTRVQDYFSFQDLYRYPEFIAGSVFFKNGTKITCNNIIFRNN